MHDKQNLYEITHQGEVAAPLPADVEAVGRYPLVDTVIKRLTARRQFELPTQVLDTDDHEKKQKLYDEMARLDEEMGLLRRLSESHRGWGNMREPHQIAFSQELITRLMGEYPELEQLAPEYRTVYVYTGASRSDVDTLRNGRGLIEGLQYKDKSFLEGKSEAMREKYEPVSVLSVLKMPVEIHENIPDELSMAA